MKKTNKLIQKIKNNIPGFVTGILMCSMVGVAAATYFPSNSVTYSNTLSGLKATDVQSAIDELYNKCFPPTAGDSILEKASIATSGDGLYKDEYEDRYFYRGKSPNNYITFNNETWRIISIESDGTIKIMRNENIEDIEWDSSNSNNWTRPSTLNTYLNGTYYNRLNETSQRQIVAKNWSIGALTDDNNSNNNLTIQINNENSQVWYGKIALITLSEYIRTNSNQNTCGTFNKAESSGCQYTTWMSLKSTYMWTLSPHAGSSNHVFTVYSYSSVNLGEDNAYTINSVYPTVYLSSNLTISGNGTSSDPYRIES